MFVQRVMVQAFPARFSMSISSLLVVVAAFSTMLLGHGAVNTYLAEHVAGRGDVGEEEPPPGTDRPEEPVDDCPVQQEL